MNIPGLLIKLQKLYVSFRLYGFNRTYIKSFGRYRFRFLPRLPLQFWSVNRNVGIIGCGQFATSTIGYFLKKQQGNIISACFDPDEHNAATFAWYYRCIKCSSPDDLLKRPEIEIVYIASNHASHTPYAIQAMLAGKVVYVEKPLSTSYQQFELLQKTLKETNGKIFIGYNRPWAPAIQVLGEHLHDCTGAMTINYFITGHKIAPDHWYRRQDEGTRICGNVGHWLDLTIHLLWKKERKPSRFTISLVKSNALEPDDNVSITLLSDLGDLITIILSSRDEPFEGINETINCQCDNVICKIDDFRHMTIWVGSKFRRWRYFRKSIGHQQSVLQPFNDKQLRDWTEVEISTLLMLRITQMVRTNEEAALFLINHRSD